MDWKTTAAGLATIGVAIGNAVLDYIHGQPVNLAALVPALTTGFGLIAAKDAPKAVKPGGTIASLPSGGAAAAALLLMACSGCATLRGSSFTASAGGQTVTGSVDKDTGTVCTTYTPPIVYLGESCSVICASSKAPFVDLTCTQLQGSLSALHTIHLVRASP